MSLRDQMAAYGDPDYQPVPPAPAQAAPVVKQGRDKAIYTRQQKGHSLILHLLFGWLALYIPAIYITFSPNHYWHA